MEFQEVEPPDDVITSVSYHRGISRFRSMLKTMYGTSRTTGEGFELTATGPSTLIKGTFGKTTEPSGMEYTSTSEQSISLR